MRALDVSSRGRSWAALRASQWWYFALLPAAGLGRADLARPELAALAFGRGALIASLALAFCYGINSIHDRAMDRSPAKNPLAGVTLVSTETAALVWSCGASALLVARVVSARSAAFVLLSLVAGALYSAGPRLKSYPFVGTLTNLGIFLPLMGISGSHVSPTIAITFTALLVQNQLWHERADLDEDRAAGVRTTAAILGERGTALAGCVAGALGAMAIGGSLLSVAGPLETAAALACLSAGSAAPIAADHARRRVHRTVAIAGGALAYAATLVSS